MKITGYLMVAAVLILLNGCVKSKSLLLKVFETSESGNKLTELTNFEPYENKAVISILPDEKFQTITGIGGSFTESSAYLLNQLSIEKRKQVIEAYFGETGAKYSLTRTHMNSCDFSLKNYSYAPIEDDMELDHFTIQEDKDDIIPMIKDAMSVSKDGFKIISSPWTAPIWMKDNKDWKGGKLLPAYYESWALFFSKYVKAYQTEGINIWGVTVENEPLGNGNNWESMHFAPEEMNEFVVKYLSPKLKSDGQQIKILGYDQNRDEELKKWVDVMYQDEKSTDSYDGTAVHWYASTFDYFPDALQYVHSKAPEKHLIQTEGCIDAEVPKWRDDQWYWNEEATDWGWDWAPQDRKHFHPKYSPVFRYARDIIGCLNNWVDGWVDWNMVLDQQGGPNWAKNWCTAPVIVDIDKDEVYFTPLYYVMSQFSRFIRPEAVKVGCTISNDKLMTTAVTNPDGNIVLIIFNPTKIGYNVEINLNDRKGLISIHPKALQTIEINQTN